MAFVFGELVKGFRERIGLTQQELADEMGTSRSGVSAWERSLHLPDSREVVLRLSEVLYLSPEETDRLLMQADFPPQYGNGGSSYGYLRVRSRVEGGRLYVLREGRHVLGRDPGQCDLVIHEAYGLVSRRHAEIYREGNHVYAADLTSSNGTYLDGRRMLMARPLAPGEHLLLGGSVPAEGVCLLEFAREAASTWKPGRGG